LDVAPNLILQKEAERTENAAFSPFPLLPPVESFVVLDLDKRDLGQFPPATSPDRQRTAATRFDGRKSTSLWAKVVVDRDRIG
jgi:hypothetical protein